MSNNFCYRCGARLSDDALFCPNCGSRVGAEERETAPAGMMTPEIDYNWNDEATLSEKYFSFKGRLNRWSYFCRSFAIQILIMFVAFITGGGEPTITLVFNFFASLLCIFLGVRRLHDLNRSGWFMLIGLIPLIGFFFGLYMLFAKGTDGPNNYGPDPLQTSGYSVV